MKKLGLPLLFVSMLFAAPAFAGEEPKAAPSPSLQSDDVIQLGPDHERLCREAESLQENRIRDLRAAIEYDKKIESELLNGAKVRDADATIKEGHAKQWRDHASKNEKKRAAFNAFASWLETEARTDRNFATERRQAAGIIGKGWREAFEAIKGHERFLADLKTHCGS
jgi:hypothetical protein